MCDHIYALEKKHVVLGQTNLVKIENYRMRKKKFDLHGY